MALTRMLSGPKPRAERPGQADDRRLGRRVGRHSSAPLRQAIEEKLMIEPPPSFLHLRAHGLRGEEVRPEIDGLRAGPSTPR